MSTAHPHLDEHDIARLRDRLFPFAYHLLGDPDEARDAVSEALTSYLEKEKAGGTAEVRNPEAYLFTMVRNQAIDALNRQKRQEYVGPWLPEPLIVGTDRTESTVDCGFAFALLLNRLSPNERAVFLMKECFGFDHREIAEQFDLTEAHCRKILQRSREKLGQAGQWKHREDPEEKGRLLQAFLGAAQTGDLGTLQALLHEDITIYSDGGGKVTAALKPVSGSLPCFRFITGLLSRGSRDAEPPSFQPLFLDGEPYVLIVQGGVLDSFISFETEIGSLSMIYIQRNPDKLKKLQHLVTK